MSQPHNAALEAASRRPARKRVPRRPDFNGQVELAKIYFDDGAPFSAARILRRLAEDLEAHGNAFTAALEAACRGRI